jgi:hypothetical protein
LLKGFAFGTIHGLRRSPASIHAEKTIEIDDFSKPLFGASASVPRTVTPIAIRQAFSKTMERK